jgi:DNA helicase-2/ATP-dependent DNA helicase PcrA
MFEDYWYLNISKMSFSRDFLRFNEFFQEELKRLNHAQREAVEQTEGPVMVIAGPGTGKTHILAMRIGNILTRTDSKAHNILCLTFTDAGVKAMKDKLLRLIGPEAYRIPVFTFHSFCNSIIQNNLEKFGRYGLEPVSELERVEFIRNILSKLPSDHPLKKDKPDYLFYEKHLQHLFQRMKAENWTVEFVNTRIHEFLKSLPEREDYQYKVNRRDKRKGEPKLAEIAEVTEKAEKFRSGVSLFPVFEEQMNARKRYDYEDMILWVLRAFEENPSLLLRYQEQFLYFLVDEFQDTNGAQYEILRKLIGYWPNPNVFIVGDDDQSIFEFQGARLKNLINFYETYKEHLTTVVLTDNYRSSQKLLDASANLITFNKIRIAGKLDDVGSQKMLFAKNPAFAEAQLPPQIIEYPTRLQEEVAIASQIEHLKQQGFPLHEVAVIYARHKQSSRLMQLLSARGISFMTRRSQNVLQFPLVKNLLEMLEYIKMETGMPYSGEHLLFRMMHFPHFGIPAMDIARLSVTVRLQSNAEKHLTFREALSDEPFLSSAGVSAIGPFLQLSDFLNLSIQEQAGFSVPQMTEFIINRSGMLRHVLSKENHAEAVKVLFAFLNFVRREAERDPFISLEKLFEIIDRMNESKISLPLVTESEISPAYIMSDSGETQNGSVSLLTAHAAKGLEFQKVFLIDCVEDYWEKSKGTNYGQFFYPDTLTFAGEEDIMEAKRRLFFVAMTRAKESLQISYSVSGDDGKSLQRTQFIGEVCAATDTSSGIEVKTGGVIPEELVDAQTKLLTLSSPVVYSFDEAAINKLLENYALSISDLNTYLKCPLSFYYEKILRVPVLPRKATFYGNAFHDALKRGFQKFNIEKKAFPSPEIFASLFEEEFRRKRGFFTPIEFRHLLDTGKRQIADYCRQKEPTWPVEFQVEYKYSHVEANGVPLTGVIDRVDYNTDGRVHIVDYKSGAVRKNYMNRPNTLRENPSKSAETEEALYGGLYWRQLVFYKILLESYPSNNRLAGSAEISYLRPNDKGEFQTLPIKYKAEDTIFMMNLMRETYSKIMNQEFYHGCGDPDCHWCSFMKQQALFDSFASEEMESLDD